MAELTNSNGLFSGRRWLIWVVAIVAAIFLASSMWRDDAVPINAATVSRGPMRSVISTNGKVEPIHNFEAHAPLGTNVKRVLVKEGDHVKRGQLLVELNDATARDQAARALSQVRGSQADLNAVHSGGTQEEVLTLDSLLSKARTDRDFAQRNLDALRRLQQQGAASPGEVKQAEDALSRADADLKLLEQKQKDRYSKPEIARTESQQEAAQAAYAAAEDVLSQLNVRAPFDGVVYAVPVREGTFVNPGDLVLQEADLSKVLVRSFVDEPDVGRLAAGQKIEVTWDAIPGRIWQGTVTGVPATVRLHGTRTVGEVTCTVDNGDFKLLPNVNVSVTIVTAEEQNALTVPREAIRQDANTTFLFQVVNDQLVRREVHTSLSNLTQVEITGGLPDNAVVAITSTNSKPLRNGLAVKVVR